MWCGCVEGRVWGWERARGPGYKSGNDQAFARLSQTSVIVVVVVVVVDRPPLHLTQVWIATGSYTTALLRLVFRFP